jgi:tetratricopeptide (TPR) repeat protein
MAQEHYQYIVNILEKTTLPTSTEFTDEARKIFEAACDAELMYTGDLGTLIQSLRLFIQTDVQPYAYAGAAKIIARSSYFSDDNYDPKGIAIAMQWFDKARAIVSDRFEINLIAFNLYDNARQNAKCRTVLDDLKAADPTVESNYRYAISETRYWGVMKNLARVEEWNKKAFKAAQNDIQRLYALKSLGKIYTNSGKIREGLALYQQVVKINPGDAWTWHNMSIFYMQIGDHAQAISCNDRALSIGEFGAARDVHQRLAGARLQNKVVGTFKKLFGG